MVKGKRSAVAAIPPRAEEKPEPKPEPETKPVPLETTPDAFPRNGQEKFNIYIADGKLDTAPMREKSRERLRSVLQESLRDSEVRVWLGIAESEKAQAVPLISPLMMRGLWETVANVQAQVYAKKAGLPFETVKAIVGWTNDEAEMLSGSSAALANKYIPIAWLQYSDVALFVLTLASLMKAKASALAYYIESKKVAGAPHKTERQPEASPTGRVEESPQTDRAISSIGVSG